MRILVQGAGALGCLLGFHLAAAGHEVTLGFRREPERWPRREGSPILSLVSKTPDAARSVPIRLAWPGREIAAADLLLLTTKAQDAEEAAGGAEGSLVRGGAALLLSNGLGLEPAVSAHFSSSLFLRGIAYCGALLDSPGVVRCTGEGKIVVGLWEDRDAGDARLGSVVNTFCEAGIPAEAAADLHRALWEKAMANLAINPLGALARVRNGAVGADPRLLGIAREVLREACAIAALEGIQIDPEEAQEFFQTTAAATAENENSMLRDVLTGKWTEIDYLNGYIARRGKERGVAVPVNSALAAWVKAYHPADES
ncbi:MAG: ketopantoate reductase family protein [Nitrospinota bacterium]